jgi:hypothetical protein
MLVQKYSTWSAKQFGVAISTVAGRFYDVRKDANITISAFQGPPSGGGQTAQHQIRCLTHEDDPLLVPPIAKHTLCPSQPGLFHSLTDLDGKCGFGLGKGLGRVFESEVGTVL